MPRYRIFFAFHSGVAGDSQLAGITQASDFISPYETNGFMEFSSMSGSGQNERCEALNEQNERGFKGAALSQCPFPASLNWPELSMPGPWGGWRQSCFHVEPPLKLFAKVSALSANR